MNDETIAEMVKNWLSAAGNGLAAQTPDELVSRIKGREKWIKGEIEWRDKLIYSHLDNLNKAEAKLAAVDNYVSYVAQAWEHQAAAMSFEEWFTASSS